MIVTLEVRVETPRTIEPGEIAYLVQRLIELAQEEIRRRPDFYVYEYQHGSTGLNCAVFYKD